MSQDFWVFGYGSLMWNPGFDHIRAARAVVQGYHRDLCILSYLYRGTRDCPGLVMGLNRGGSCVGRAFLVAAQNKEAVIAYLDAREMPNRVYKPQWVETRLNDATVVQAYSFVADEDHEQHVGTRPLEEKIEFLLQGKGQAGTSVAYLEQTLAHLKEWDIRDENLEMLLKTAYQVRTERSKTSNS